MVRVEVQQKVIAKALKESGTPFAKSGNTYQWAGHTRLKSKKTGRIYDVDIEIGLACDRRVDAQVAACVTREDGTRIEDLVVASMVQPKLKGDILIKGLPGGPIKHDFLKFMKSAETSTTQA